MSGTALTLDEAVEIPTVDDSPVESRAVTLPEPTPHSHDLDQYDEGTLEPQATGGLTLDEAVARYADDGNGSAPRLRPDSVVIAIDGKALTLSDLAQSYRTADQLHGYIARLEDEYRAVQDAAQGVVSSAWELSRLMMAQVPQEPDAALARFNPDEYVRQKAAFDYGMEYVAHVLQQAQEAHGSALALQHRYHGTMLQTENAKLVQAFPETANMEGRSQFFHRMLDVAHACGFTREEFEQVVDHRIFRLGALALKGMEAVAEAPRPNEKRRHRRKRYSEAMERLARTGSLDDAVAAWGGD